MSKTERYEEAAAYWGLRCASRIGEGLYGKITSVVAMKVAMCAFIAHPELRETA